MKIMPFVLFCSVTATFVVGCVSEKEKAEQSLNYWQKRAALVTVGMKLSKAEAILPISTEAPRKKWPCEDQLTAPQITMGTGSGYVTCYELDKHWKVAIAYDKDERVRRPVEIERNTMTGPTSAGAGYPINLVR